MEEKILKEFGEAAYHLATGSDDTEITELLTTAVNLNLADECGRKVLMIAAKKGHTEIAELLISAGINVNNADECGNTALIIASKHGHTKIAELLINNRADINKIKRPPILGKIIYFVPERKETKGIEIILIKILGIIIFKIISALTKLSPKIDKILPAK